MMRLVRWMLKKKGILCMMCQDALALGESNQVCKECADELYDIQMHDYHRDMQEVYFR